MGRGCTCDKRAPWRYAPAVAAAWQLFTDDPEERARFSDLRATLALERSLPSGAVCLDRDVREAHARDES